MKLFDLPGCQRAARGCPLAWDVNGLARAIALKARTGACHRSVILSFRLRWLLQKLYVSPAKMVSDPRTPKRPVDGGTTNDAESAEVSSASYDAAAGNAARASDGMEREADALPDPPRTLQADRGTRSRPG